jgi:BlaI family penicillinase repressor
MTRLGMNLGDRELDIMGVLWRLGPGTVPEVRDRLPVMLAYNTVLTILRNLESKGLVDHTEEGRYHRYFYAVPEVDVRGGLVSQFVDKLFDGSLVGLLTHLVKNEDLSPSELGELQRLLDDRQSKAVVSGNAGSGARRTSSKSAGQRKKG